MRRLWSITVGRDRNGSRPAHWPPYDGGRTSSPMLERRPRSGGGACGCAGRPRTGTFEVWRIVRNRIALLGKSKSLHVALVAAVALALVGPTYGYAQPGKAVTLPPPAEPTPHKSPG